MEMDYVCCHYLDKKTPLSHLCCLVDRWIWNLEAHHLDTTLSVWNFVGFSYPVMFLAIFSLCSSPTPPF